MCIFVVEDDPLIRMILVEELVDAGYGVREAATADQAIAAFETIEPTPRVLVTDVHMPGRHDGLDVAAHARSRLPAIPVIFTTGRPDALMPLDRLGDGQVLVRKPYVPGEIIRHIRTLLAA